MRPAPSSCRSLWIKERSISICAAILVCDKHFLKMPDSMYGTIQSDHHYHDDYDVDDVGDTEEQQKLTQVKLDIPTFEEEEVVVVKSAAPTISHHANGPRTICNSGSSVYGLRICIAVVLMVSFGVCGWIGIYGNREAITATAVGVNNEAQVVSITGTSTNINSNVDPSNPTQQFEEENLDTGLATFPWMLQNNETTGEEYYLGYLEFCGTKASGIYAYRSSTRNPADVDVDDDGYECRNEEPAPVIRMFPRVQYRLILINTADEPTNIHLHNAHISGVGIVDDVTRIVHPGNCLMYEWYIADDADVGTYWYHPHLHPYLSHQSGGGAFGLLIVDESNKALKEFYPDHLQRFFTKKEVLLQFLSVTGKYTSTGQRLNKINGRVSRSLDDDDDDNDDNDPMTITLLREDYYYFRISSVVITDNDSYVRFTPQDACDVHAVAYDGVYRSSIPAESDYIHHLTVSSRVDLAVKCTKDAILRFGQQIPTSIDSIVNIRVISNDGDQQQKQKKEEGIEEEKAVVSSSSSSIFWDPILRTTWNPRRAYYLPNLKNGTVDEIWDIYMMKDVVKVVNATTGKVSSKESVFSINNHTWDAANAIRAFELNKLVEWNIYNSYGHPFHPHIDRMMIVTPGGCGGRYEEGEYFDTINSKAPCKVRIQFFDFGGRLIVHCHNVVHEDKGMQVWLDITNGPGDGVQGIPEVQCSEAYSKVGNV